MQPEDLILPQEREHPLLFWANPVCTNGVASYKEAKIRFFFVMLTSPKSIIHFQYLKMEPFDLFFFFFNLRHSSIVRFKAKGSHLMTKDGTNLYFGDLIL